MDATPHRECRDGKDQDALTDDALDAVFQALASMAIASAANARLACRRWAAIGSHALSAARRRMATAAAAPSGVCGHFYTAQAEITCALALDSRPRLMRALDAGTADIHDSINLFGLVTLLASTGVEVGIVATEKGVQRSEAYDSVVPCDAATAPRESLPPIERAVLYGAAGCVDLLIERGARIDPPRAGRLLCQFLGSCVWTEAAVCVGPMTSPALGVLSLGQRPRPVRYIDPMPIVRVLLAALPPLEGTQRIPRDVAHPFVAMTNHISRIDRRGVVVRTPSRDDAALVVAALVNAGYTTGVTHSRGFGLASATNAHLTAGMTMDLLVALTSMSVADFVSDISRNQAHRPEVVDLLDAILVTGRGTAVEALAAPTDAAPDNTARRVVNLFSSARRDGRL